MEAISIRAARPADQSFLWDMLYHSLHVPEGAERPPRDVVSRPEFARYVVNWGRPGDLGFVAVDSVDGKPVAAIWLRLFTPEERGYGYVDRRTPELGMAVLPEWRGQGIGSALLERLLEAAGDEYGAVSLSVFAGNRAVRLYERAGFQRVGITSGSITMVKRLGR